MSIRPQNFFPDDIVVDSSNDIQVDDVGPPALDQGNPQVDAHSPSPLIPHPSSTTPEPITKDLAPENRPGGTRRSTDEPARSDGELDKFRLKPRFSCKNCRIRKAKCSKDYPSCIGCLMRGETCDFGSQVPVVLPALPPSPSASPFDPRGRVNATRSADREIVHELHALSKEVGKLLEKFKEKTGEDLDIGLWPVPHHLTPAPEGGKTVRGEGRSGSGLVKEAERLGSSSGPRSSTIQPQSSDRRAITGVTSTPSSGSTGDRKSPLESQHSESPPTSASLMPPPASTRLLKPLSSKHLPPAQFQVSAPMPGPNASFAAQHYYQQSLSASNPYHPASIPYQPQYPYIPPFGGYQPFPHPQHLHYPPPPPPPHHPSSRLHPHPQTLTQHHQEYNNYLTLMSRLPKDMQQEGLPRGISTAEGSGSRKRKRSEEHADRAAK